MVRISAAVMPWGGILDTFLPQFFCILPAYDTFRIVYFGTEYIYVMKGLCNGSFSSGVTISWDDGWMKNQASKWKHSYIDRWKRI